MRVSWDKQGYYLQTKADETIFKYLSVWVWFDMIYFGINISILTIFCSTGTWYNKIQTGKTHQIHITSDCGWSLVFPSYINLHYINLEYILSKVTYNSCI